MTEHMLTTADLLGPQGQADARSSVAGAEERTAPSVLVVEDSATQRALITAHLEARGYRVTAAENAAEARRSLEDALPEAVLLDWELPDVDGIELVREWRGHPDYRWVPVLMVTAHGIQEGIGEALEAGAFDFVPKPVQPVELFARLKNAIKTRRLQAELLRLATRDPLTGLYNRRVFVERLELEIARCVRNGREAIVVMLDLDHFKRINDENGHDVGDLILSQLATQMIKHVRTTDTIARVGGEEFAMLLPESDLASAQTCLERIRTQIRTGTWGTEDRPIEVTLSAGLAALTHTETAAPEALLKAADLALYRAKAEGRDRVVVYDPERS